MMAQACKPKTQEEEAGDSLTVQSQPGTGSECKASLSYSVGALLRKVGMGWSRELVAVKYAYNSSHVEGLKQRE